MDERLGPIYVCVMSGDRPIPDWLRAQVQPAHVSPNLRTLVAQLPQPLSVRAELPAGAPLSTTAAGLLKLSLLGHGLRLDELRELPFTGTPRLVVSGPGGELALGPAELAERLEELIDRLLLTLLPPVEVGALLRQLAHIGTTASTLQTITTHMLGTYDVDLALHVMLSGITAGYCLGFNRAAIFLHDPETQTLRGHAGIGPADEQEAGQVWQSIESTSTGIEELIASYDTGRFDSRFEAQVKGIQLRLGAGGPADDEVSLALTRDEPVLFGGERTSNPALASLGLRGEFVLASLRAHRRLLGLVFADDRWLPTPINPSRLRQLKFFIDQTALIWENLELLNQQQELARRDPLTGALNRRELEELLPRIVATAHNEGGPLALLLIDVDWFKQINDRRGHAEGDRILRGLVSIAQPVLRSGDLFARYGGDEFVLLLQGASATAAANVAERVRERVRERLGVTVSLGLANFPADGQAPAELLAAADRRLYEAKRLGRDRLVGG